MSGAVLDSEKPDTWGRDDKREIGRKFEFLQTIVSFSHPIPRKLTELISESTE
jgi:hypothetical protein